MVTLIPFNWFILSKKYLYFNRISINLSFLNSLIFSYLQIIFHINFKILQKKFAILDFVPIFVSLSVVNEPNN